ncbi:MAG TPA: Sec-independent protein translocase protein TatB [Steroidobacteraceae bacterium]|nr:Sec-independent protein translocase protein TatB [Steroidobacteraceae bacterium]
MLDFGFSEILLTSAIALVVLGPERLPKVARQVGNWVGRARVMARQLSEQLEREVNAEELLRQESKIAGATERPGPIESAALIPKPPLPPEEPLTAPAREPHPTSAAAMHPQIPTPRTAREPHPTSAAAMHPPTATPPPTSADPQPPTQ